MPDDQRDSALRDRMTLRALLAELVDPDPCEYDHNGLCQAHNLDPRPCPHERAKAILRPPPETP